MVTVEAVNMSSVTTIYFANRSDWHLIQDAAALDEIPPTVLLRKLGIEYAKKRIAKSGVCPECGRDSHKKK